MTRDGIAFASCVTRAENRPPPSRSPSHALTEMKTPVQNSRGRLIYTGHIARSAFNAWAQSIDGLQLLDKVGSELRWALFGRIGAARRRVWRETQQAIRGERLAGALQREVDAVLGRLDTIAHAHDLPRVSVDLRRL